MKRWPIIRHIRYYLTLRRINQHYEFWRTLGRLPVHADSDYRIADEIWYGRR